MQGHNVLYSTVSKTPRQIPVPYSEGFLAGPPDWDGAGGGLVRGWRELLVPPQWRHNLMFFFWGGGGLASSIRLRFSLFALVMLDY